MSGKDRPPRGPRGGTTTVTKTGMVKKNLWVPFEMAEELRSIAYRERRSEADLIRAGLGREIAAARRRLENDTG